MPYTDTDVGRVQYGGALLAIGLGLAMLLGGPSRHSGTAYAFIVQTGGAYVWGGIFIGLGLAIAVVPKNHNRIALYWLFRIAGVLYFVFGVMFAFAAIEYNNANMTAPVAYWWMSLTQFGMAERVHPKFPVNRRGFLEGDSQNP